MTDTLKALKARVEAMQADAEAWAHKSPINQADILGRMTAAESNRLLAVDLLKALEAAGPTIADDLDIRARGWATQAQELETLRRVSGVADSRIAACTIRASECRDIAMAIRYGIHS